MVNNLTGSGIVAGNAAIFRAKFRIPADASSDFDLVLEGDSLNGVHAIGASVFDSGLAAYFPPSQLVTDINADTVTISFGNVQNVNSVSATDVWIDFTFAIDETAGTGSKSLPIATVGDTNVAFPDIDILQNVSSYRPTLYFN